MLPLDSNPKFSFKNTPDHSRSSLDYVTQHLIILSFYLEQKIYYFGVPITQKYYL